MGAQRRASDTPCCQAPLRPHPAQPPHLAGWSPPSIAKLPSWPAAMAAATAARSIASLPDSVRGLTWWTQHGTAHDGSGWGPPGQPQGRGWGSHCQACRTDGQCVGQARNAAACSAHPATRPRVPHSHLVAACLLAQRAQADQPAHRVVQALWRQGNSIAQHARAVQDRGLPVGCRTGYCSTPSVTASPPSAARCHCQSCRPSPATSLHPPAAAAPGAPAAAARPSW